MEKLRKEVKDFIRERDWEQYHAPKNLAMALSAEVAEIVEIFQWKKADQPLSADEKENLRQEIGDVLIYLIELADKFDFDLIEAGLDKLKLNSDKYPMEKARGKADKYTAYK
jgi:NTP pyrophosphatase (non-canonical NTP hydrolase)